MTGTGAAMQIIARVGAERFAFRVADVEEVLDAPRLLAAPRGPAGLAGFTGLAGQLVHRNRTLRVYDAAWVFGIARASSSPSAAPPPRQTTAALVLRAADDRVALLVDDVESLASLDPNTFRPPPHGTDPDGLLDGVCLPDAGIRALIGVANSAAIIARASLVAAS